jgi:hypothetical protein
MDLMTYITIVLVIYAYRMLIRRLPGEAKYVQLGESDQNQSPPDRLLVKKLGKEFLISVSDIDWSTARRPAMHTSTAIWMINTGYPPKPPNACPATPAW